LLWLKLEEFDRNSAALIEKELPIDEVIDWGELVIDTFYLAH
jgi:hypothetical protein